VLGKAGRADTSTDPAPISMLETVITLKPTSEWRRVETWYSGWAPEWTKRVLRHITPDHISEERLHNLLWREGASDVTGQALSRQAEQRSPGRRGWRPGFCV
jgi:Cu/Ag efflux pump CusA